jgi:hypothetical protein
MMFIVFPDHLIRTLQVTVPFCILVLIVVPCGDVLLDLQNLSLALVFSLPAFLAPAMITLLALAYCMVFGRGGECLWFEVLLLA